MGLNDCPRSVDGWSYTCLGPKNPVPAKAVCGRVQNPIGESVSDFDLQVMSKDKTVVGEVRTDSNGNFMFPPLPRGEYDLAVNSNGWRLFWPVRVTSSKGVNKCTEPLKIRLSLVCSGSVSKKGYHV